MKSTLAPATTGVDFSAAAKERMLAVPGERLLLGDWLRAVFLHYEVDPQLLQRATPFDLDLCDGRAYVSLVAFTMRGLRPARGGRWTSWLMRPIATHGLLNVRTYVRHRGEVAIHFLSEWIPNRLSVLVGPRTFGLPYRHGRLEYSHAHELDLLCGTVTDGPARLHYTATPHGNAIDCGEFAPCAPGSLGEFLLERYTAFTSCGWRPRFFRVWHEPWPQQEIDVNITDDSLLAVNFPWFRGAKLAAANYSPGVRDVWMGRPHTLRACQRGCSFGKNSCAAAQVISLSSSRAQPRRRATNSEVSLT